jgi:hypothetical protein
MTLEPPPVIEVTRRGKGHGYTLNGRPTPGVTTILDRGYPKPALVGWAADETARWASENLDVMRDLGPVAGYEKARKARFTSNETAKARGTQVHQLAEQVSHGAEVEIPPHLVGYVDAAIRFLDDFDVTPIRTEQTVANPEHGYCGTFDIYADTNIGGILFDYKTSKSPPYPETALQRTAYRWAPWWLEPDGSTGPGRAIDQTAVVWLTPERYEVFPIETGPDVFRAFLYVAQVAAFTQADRSAYVGEPMTKTSTP